MTNSILFANTRTAVVKPYPVTYDSINRQLTYLADGVTHVIGVNVLAIQEITLTATHTTTFDQSGTYAVSATSSASADEAYTGPVYSIAPNVENTAGATVDASTGVVTLATLGVFTVLASFPATENYAAGTATQTITILGNIQTITVSPTDSTDFSQSGIYAVSATTDDTDDGAAVVYSIDAIGNTAGATVDASTGVVTFATPGTCTVLVNSAATLTYAIAAQVQQVITVAKEAQSTLVVTSIAGTSGVGTPLTLTSSGGSGTGAVTYVVTDAGTAGATLTDGGTTVTGATTGTCTVTATKATDVDYTAVSSTATTVTFA